MGIQEFLLKRAWEEGYREGLALVRRERLQQEMKEYCIERSRIQLRKKQFTPAQLAYAFDLPIDLVLSIQKEIESE